MTTGDTFDTAIDSAPVKEGRMNSGNCKPSQILLDLNNPLQWFLPTWKNSVGNKGLQAD